jgi:hypothetical protein
MLDASPGVLPTTIPDNTLHIGCRTLWWSACRCRRTSRHGTRVPQLDPARMLRFMQAVRAEGSPLLQADDNTALVVTYHSQRCTRTVRKLWHIARRSPDQRKTLCENTPPSLAVTRCSVHRAIYGRSIRQQLPIAPRAGSHQPAGRRPSVPLRPTAGSSCSQALSASVRRHVGRCTAMAWQPFPQQLLAGQLRHRRTGELRHRRASRSRTAAAFSHDCK